MLGDLQKASVPCPEVLYADEDMLALEWIEHEQAQTSTRNAARNAAIVVAALHTTTFASFGYPYDTPLGSLLQDNSASASWIPFYRAQRLTPLVRDCVDAGQLDVELARAIEALPLEELLAHRASVRPALVHGDLWSGNMLFVRNGLAALIDPALYFADPQIDCAMLRLFSAFDRDFFDAYREAARLALSREEERLCQDLYALYPLLVHCRLFGRRYNASLARVLLKYR